MPEDATGGVRPPFHVRIAGVSVVALPRRNSRAEPSEGCSEVALLDHVLLPVVTEADARATCDALRPHLDRVQRVTALHVIEKGGGTVDKAPLDKRREDAAACLAVVETRLAGEVPVDTRTAFGTDVVETIFDEAASVGATVIAVRPRGGSRLVQFIAGDTAIKLVTDPEVPVISLPEVEGE